MPLSWDATVSSLRVTKQGAWSARRVASFWFNGCLRAELDRVAELPMRPAARAAVELVIAMHAVDPDLHNALWEQRAMDPQVELEFRRQLQAKLEENRAEIRPVDLELASFITIRAVEALVHGASLDEPERLADPRFAEEVTELLVRYLEA